MADADADADEYEEALYTDDEADLNIPIVIEDNTERGGERVVKQSFPASSSTMKSCSHELLW